MISGIGIISLLTQTRYGRVIDTMRNLNSEKFDLFRFKMFNHSKTLELEILNRRINNIDLQLDLLIKRSTYLKKGLTSLLTGAFFFILASVFILLQEFMPNEIMVPVTGSTFVGGLILLVIGGISIIIDLCASQKAVFTAIYGMREMIHHFERNT